jgi:hypothetical protein
MKVTQDKQKCYADKKRVQKEFKVGDYIYLIVKLRKRFFNIGSCAKLAHWQ